MGNRELVLRRAEVIGSGDFKELPEVLASDVVVHFGTDQVTHGIDEFVALVSSFDALADLEPKIDAVVSEDDKVATRYTVTAVHQGRFFGVEPTGKAVAFEGAGIHRVVDDKVAESWVIDDVATIMQQLTSDLEVHPPGLPASDGAPAGNDIEANKALVRRWIELANAGEHDALRDVWADDLVIHAGAAEVESFAGFRGILDPFYVAFPDIDISIEDIICERDEVVTRTMSRGTFTGEFMGKAPNGQKVEFAGVNTFRIESGRIAEEWFNDDLFTMMGQIEPR